MHPGGKKQFDPEDSSVSKSATGVKKQNTQEDGKKAQLGNFVVNVNESQSIDFEFSDRFGQSSHAAGASKQQTAIDKIMKREMDELNESEVFGESNMYELSESGVSQSIRSQGFNKKKHAAAKKKEEVPLFNYDRHDRFSSWKKDDDEFEE